jgi:hypothetical protein
VDTVRLQRFLIAVTQFQHRFSGRYPESLVFFPLHLFQLPEV